MGLLRVELNVLHELVLRLRRERTAVVDAYAGGSLGAELRRDRPNLLPCRAVPRVRLQLVLGDDRAEMSLDDLECLENRPQC